MPRILITGFFGLPAPSRAGVQMRHVVRALAPHYEVDVLVVRLADQAYVERQGGARILRVPLAEDDRHAQIEAYRRALRRQLEGADYDVVHFRDGWSGLPILELRAQLGYKAVFDATRAPMGEPASLDIGMGAALAQSEDSCLVEADHVMVPTETARSHVLRRRSAGVHVVPPGVDVDLFDWDTPVPGPPCVLYAGTVEAGRGVRLLLQAMAAVVARAEARLIIAGHIAPAFQHALHSTISELGLTDHVDLLGEVAHEAMPATMARAAVCVAPSASELSTQPMAVYPTKLLEYMACRRAVIAPRRGTAAMLLEHSTQGLLFNPGDATDLARKLLRLIQDPSLRDSLAEAGYRLVRHGHTASATRRTMRCAYAEILGQGAWQQPVVIQDFEVTDRSSMPEADRTEEFQPPFVPRTGGLAAGAEAGPEPLPGDEVGDVSDAGDGADAGHAAGEITAVELAALPRIHVLPTMPLRYSSTEGSLPVVTVMSMTDGAGSAGSEDGIIAGEVEVRPVRPELAREPGLERDPELDTGLDTGGESVFTAISSLLGSTQDDER